MVTTHDPFKKNRIINFKNMITQQSLLKSLELNSKATAIEENGEKVSYSELKQKSDKVTQFLLEKNLKPGTVVGLQIDLIADIVPCMIGVMNARCIFALIDHKLPEKRQSDMMEDMKPACLLISNHISQVKKTSSFDYHSIEKIFDTDQIENVNYPEFDENDSLYLYFTSGSTGKPKGIIGRNSSLIHFLKWEIASFAVDNTTRVSQLISPYFDAFLRDIFVPLLAGGTVCVPPKEDDFFTFDKMKSWISDQKITMIHCVPSVFRVLNEKGLSSEDFSELKYILMSGEKIVPSELRKWYHVFEDRIQLVNLYGTTETTMIRTMYKIKQTDADKARMPIGEPLPDTKILIADDEMKPCKPLITGDLYIVTKYASKGYLNDENLTREKFLSIGEEADGNIAFKTGDKARISADGGIELLGRDDRQVKLNGIRVELDEVEAVISRLSDVGEVVVTADKDQPDTLLAFIIRNNTEKDIELWKNEVIVHTKKYLPDYMIPSDLIAVSTFPRLSNGKLDFQKLIESKASGNVVLPKTDMESKMLDIWIEVLGKKEISITATFQSVGGNSLSIMRLIARIYSEYNVRLALSEIFSHPTIQKQASLIEEKIVELHIAGAEA